MARTGEQVLTGQPSVTISNTSQHQQLARTMVMLFLSLLCVVSLVTGQDTRDDGLCGPGNKAPSGRDAQCQHM